MKKKKALLLAACAVLLVVASVMGTMAYLTSTDSVTNTFSIGKVKITMDERKVDKDGNVDTSVTAPVKENEYRLMPGHEYTKDPTIHVEGGSENSWLFVKVENGIAKYETAGSNGKTIDEQILANGWSQLTDKDGNPVAGVYYKEYTSQDTQLNIQVFGSFKIAENADTVEGWKNITADNTKIVVKAYAIQADGFTTAADAWAEVSK